MDTNISKNSISFSGCGFLGIYHVGVASCIKEYSPHLYNNKIIGASAGALVSSALLSGCCLGECTTFTLKLAMDARSRALGPLSPRFALVSNLRKALDKFLPEDAHVRVSDFKCKDDLIDCLICSSFVPFYSGIFPPKFKGVHYIDGGLTDNLPIFDEQTITVSPFAGESDICPDDYSYCPHHITLAGTNVQITSNNIYRASVAFFPPAPEVLSNMCKRGFADALRFLKKNKLISCQKHISIHSALVSLRTLEFDDINGEVANKDNAVANHRVCLKKFVDSKQSGSSHSSTKIGSNDLVSFGLFDDIKESNTMATTHNYLEPDDEDGYVEYTECKECLQMGYEAFKDLPPLAVQQALQAVLDEDRNGYLSNLYKWKAFQLTSLMVVPYTFPFEVTLMITRKFLNWAPNLYNDANWFFTGLYNLCKDFLHLGHDNQSASELSTWLTSYGQYLGLFRGSNTNLNSRKRSFIYGENSDPQTPSENAAAVDSKFSSSRKECRHKKPAFGRLKNVDMRTISIREEGDDDQTTTNHPDNHFTVTDSHRSNKTNQLDVDSFEYALEVTQQMDAILSYYYLDSKKKKVPTATLR